MSNTSPPRSYLSAVLGNYCPRCRQGKLFQNPLSLRFGSLLKMHPECRVCTQPTELEVGFYYGTSYVSYATAVLVSGASFVLWWLTVGFSLDDNRFVYWIAANAVLLILLQPWLMRFARSLWLSWFVRYDPEWKTRPPQKGERVNEQQAGNW